MKTRHLKMKLNNKGFSLMELIVVIAIVVVLAGAAAVTVSMLDSSYVEDAERGIKDYMSLTRTKSMSVSAKDWYMTIGKESGDYYAYLYKVEEEIVADGGVDKAVDKIQLIDKKKLGSSVSITYSKDKEATSVKSISDTAALELHFDPATGKVNKVVYPGVDSASDLSDGIGYIGIKRNDYSINLKVYYNTGKCERE